MTLFTREREFARTYGKPLKPYKWRDPWYSKKGKLRTWLGHLRVLAEQEGRSLRKIKEVTNGGRTT